MPDWSYRTLFRPLLFRLPPQRARDLTLRTFGGLGRSPLGAFVIRTFGHMELPPLLAGQIGDVAIPYPVGLSGNLDLNGHAERALEQIGFGYVELGPVTIEDRMGGLTIERDEARETLIYSDPAANVGVRRIEERLKRSRSKRPRFIRLRASDGAGALNELVTLTERLAPYASGWFIELPMAREVDDERLKRWLQELRSRLANVREGIPMLLCIPLEIDDEALDAVLAALAPDGDSEEAPGWDGIVIDDGIRTERGFEIGPAGKKPALRLLGKLRGRLAHGQRIVCKAGVNEPQDALELMEAGADFVQLHAGLVYSGPGLPKRVNEAVLYERMKSAPAEPPGSLSSFWSSWGWLCLLGAGMIVGGAIAWLIAMTSVLLPYDESFLGIRGSDISESYPRLLRFMSHDRVTLAGTMISIGLIYYLLGKHGLSRGLHWAKTVAVTSCTVGFASFFLYLGYGYFDPAHAAAAVLLFPMFILSLRARGDRTLVHPPNVKNDRAWLLGQWGQLMMVVLGFAFAVGGLVISGVGVTGVFVPSDLVYLCMGTEDIRSFNDRLIPTIAHDRAGFGGALFCDAVAILGTALWGIRQGEKWIWRLFLLGGIPGFWGAFSVHAAIGYTDFVHLLPAYFALAIYVAGLVLLYPYLMRRGSLSQRM
ncbi:dihydroorotate dehydrogenase [Cohnella fermenti]|uniref:Dihydroorotate dehydrogenase catalytic domain-containing protein n=1 Tax=Cohnella fermenti TaxID=2565925 RepID=A0A4S4BGN3_9BACL|nr:hypothetical protein [Cohnella fermenti]THF73401.1 hypothetical protein E6C55_29330 [Cohnella fermenti]